MNTPTATSDDAFALIAYLADRDAACPLCRYNLRGLTSPRCPECGQELRLGVSLAEPYLKAWIGLLTALLLPAGMGVFWVFAIVENGLPRGRESGATPPILFHIAAIPLAIGTIAARRRFQRLARTVQLAAATVAVVVAVASFAVLMRAFAR